MQWTAPYDTTETARSAMQGKPVEADRGDYEDNKRCCDDSRTEDSRLVGASVTDRSLWSSLLSCLFSLFVFSCHPDAYL